MAIIDLSKAKIGDKFRTRNGCILKYVCKYHQGYILKDINDCEHFYYEKGNFFLFNESCHDLVEPVFDKPLDELIKIATKQFRESDDAIAEEAELQRRQEVVELAEKLVTNELFAVTNHIHDMRELGSAINLDSPAEYAFLIAEEFVNTRRKYLKEGKL